METPQNDDVSPAPTAVPAAAPTKPPRRWGRRILVAVLLLGAVAAFLPQILSLPPLRPWLMRVALRKFPGTVQVDQLSLAWWRPITASGIEVRSNTHPTTARIAAVSGDVPLGRLLLSGGNLGAFRVERPEIEMVLAPAAPAAVDVGAVPPPTFEPPSVRRDLRMELEIVGASVSVRGPEGAQPWGVQGIDIRATLVPAAESGSGFPELHTGPIKLLTRQALTVEMCDDVFQYIAPILAQTTRTSGDVSFEVDRVRWPLGHPEAADVAGRLTLHAVDVGPGPAVRNFIEIIPAFKGPIEIRLAQENVVEFQMHDGRVHHQGLAFGLPERGENLLVHSDGSVGIDQTLDLTAVVPIPTELLGSGPVRDALAKERLTFHIGGTLKKPEIERLPGDKALMGTLLGSLQELFNRPKVDVTGGDADATDGDTADTNQAVTGAIEAAKPLIDGLIQGLRERRQRRRGGSPPPAAEQPPANEPPLPPTAEPTTEEEPIDPPTEGELLAPDDPQATESPPPRRRFRRLIERLRSAPAATDTPS